MTLKTASAVATSAPKAVDEAVVRRSANYHPNIWVERFTTYVSDDEASAIATSASKAVDEAIVRRSANYHPNIWGERFTTYVSDDEVLNVWRVEMEVLKEKVRMMLLDESIAVDHPKKLNLIDSVLRLGVSYHYEQEIDELLAQIFYHIQDNSVVDYDLHQAALVFRLLRQDGHYVSCEMMFNKFTDFNGKVKKSEIADDVAGLLSLYEAAHLRIHGEVILEEALEFTTTILRSVVTANLSHPLGKLIQYALMWPVYKSVPRVSARHYISLYQQLENHDETLLRFAKLDFNILQKMHQKELSVIARWWKGLDVQSKLPWARDRIVECYLWILEVYSEPQFALARKFMTKVLALTTIIDDFYDVYGMHEELVLFTEAVKRWEISAIDMLPEFMRPCYEVLLNEYSEMEEQLSKEGNSYHIDYAKEAMKTQVKDYFEESKWINSDELPTYDEYMKVALGSIGCFMVLVTSLVGMGGKVTREDFDWLDNCNKPKIVNASDVIGRLLDDMVVDKMELEQQGVRAPWAVDCYMRQHGVSEQQTHQVFSRIVEDAWKDTVEGYLRPFPASRNVLNRALNISRSMNLTYMEGNGFSNSTKLLKACVIDLLINPVEI